MAGTKVFADGLKVERKSDEPEWVIAALGIKVEEFIPFIRAHEKNGWTNLKIKLSQKGNLYCELDSYSKDPDTIQQEGVAQVRAKLNEPGAQAIKAAEALPAFDGDDIPF